MAAENNGASAGICDQSELVQYTVGNKAHKVSQSANAILSLGSMLDFRTCSGQSISI